MYIYVSAKPVISGGPVGIALSWSFRHDQIISHLIFWGISCLFFIYRKKVLDKCISAISNRSAVIGGSWRSGVNVSSSEPLVLLLSIFIYERFKKKTYMTGAYIMGKVHPYSYKSCEQCDAIRWGQLLRRCRLGQL